MRTTSLGSMVLGLPLLLTLACGPSASSGDDDSSNTGPDAGAEACATPGATRCTGHEYQTCANGAWTTSDTCAAEEACYPGFGCAECDPTRVQVCVGDDVYACSGGVLGDKLESCGAQMCSGGSCGGTPEDCAEATQVMYVVDKENELLSFDPREDANTFHLIGTLECPAGTSYPDLGGGPATPFSMSVDRSGRAWVLYSSGEIFLVDTDDASCQASGYVKGTGGFELFGMSFVSDAAGSDAETLFVAGGAASIASPFSNGASDLGRIDTSSFAAVNVGAIAPQSGQRNPDLTGTGNGELWGFFPATGLFAHGAVAQIDKVTRARLQSFDLPAESGIIDAWAFAHYGGRYYIFVTAAENRVLRLDPMGNGGAGKVDVIVPSSPYTVVGAGVSTCAPVVVE
jgi:hypothetical protein